MTENDLPCSNAPRAAARAAADPAACGGGRLCSRPAEGGPGHGHRHRRDQPRPGGALTLLPARAVAQPWLPCAAIPFAQLCDMRRRHRAAAPWTSSSVCGTKRHTASQSARARARARSEARLSYYAGLPFLLLVRKTVTKYAR